MDTFTDNGPPEVPATGRKLGLKVWLHTAGGSPGAEAVYLVPLCGFLYTFPLLCPLRTCSSAFFNALLPLVALDFISWPIAVTFFATSTLISGTLIRLPSLPRNRWYTAQAAPVHQRPAHKIYGSHMSINRFLKLSASHDPQPCV